jgi:hypothetical protein
MRLFALGVGAVLLAGSVIQAQETKDTGARAQKEEGGLQTSSEEERSPVEFGFRSFWGNVYGRPDLPFTPDLATSKLNEYNDLRNNAYIRRARVTFDNLFGTESFLDYQTQSSFYKNQSHLASFGQYGKFKLQLRYDEIPHIYTNTARTLYTQLQPGVFTIPLSIRQAFQTASSTGTAAQINNNLPNFVSNQLSSTLQFVVPQIQRRAGTGSFSFNVMPDWDLLFSFRRETENGTRPIGTILYNSPSASGSTQPGSVANRQSPGVGEELPEPLDYVTKTIRAMTEFGKQQWRM